jgi:hypothetical protein
MPWLRTALAAEAPRLRSADIKPTPLYAGFSQPQDPMYTKTHISVRAPSICAAKTSNDHYES